MPDALSKILEVCRSIQSVRDLNSIFKHASGEMVELKEEIDDHLNYLPGGLDGVTGEAIDVILCMVDIIYQYDEKITEDEIYAIVCSKLDKWVRVYSNN